MTREAGHFLEKARRLLEESRTMLDFGLNEAAGRSAYLAGCHAAQALYFRKDGQVGQNAQGRSGRTASADQECPGSDPGLRVFLSQSYDMKAVADYETGPDALIPAERMAEALEVATRFVAYFEQLLSEA